MERSPGLLGRSSEASPKRVRARRPTRLETRAFKSVRKNFETRFKDILALTMTRCHSFLTKGTECSLDCPFAAMSDVPKFQRKLEECPLCVFAVSNQ